MTSPRTSPLRYRAFAAAVAILGICTIPGFAQSPDVVVQWNAAVLQGVGDSKLGPPMVARALFIVHNCIYDAWAAYSRTAVGTVLREFFSQENPPASTWVGVSALAVPEFLIEIEATAVLD